MRVLGILFALTAIDTSLEDSQDDEPEIVDPERCKCGEKHVTKQSPNPRGTKDELMRLGLVLIDNSMRVYIEKLFRPKIRRELDDLWVCTSHKNSSIRSRTRSSL
jgi:hypothetical protein